MLPLYSVAPLLQRGEGDSVWGAGASPSGAAAATATTTAAAAAGSPSFTFSETLREDFPIVILNPSPPGGPRASAYKGLAVGTLIAPSNP